MRRLFDALRHGWQALRRPAEPPVPFQIACPCGRVHRGLRAARSQVARCPGCGEVHFVFPRSPLPAVPDEQPGGPPAAAGGGRGRSPWLLPLVAAGLTLAAVVAAYVFLFSSLLRPAGHPAERPGSPAALTRRDGLAAGRRLLREGNFHLAVDTLQAARDRYAGDPDLDQLHRQARLLTQLLRTDRGLEKVIEEGQMVGNAAEWQERFREYRGRAVLFDDVVLRDPNGEHRLSTYEVNAGDERAHVRLDLNLLKCLPLERPRRLLFGARLESVAREGGVWVIRFERDSGVLMTDEGAVAACGLAPLDDDLREVLRRQAEWAPTVP
jgi:hypothetical protein